MSSVHAPPEPEASTSASEADSTYPDEGIADQNEASADKRCCPRAIVTSLGQGLVDMVNPRLSRYGERHACRLALCIFISQGLMAFVVACHVRRDVAIVSALVDYSTALEIGKRDPNEGVCGTYTVQRDVFEQQLAFMGPVTLGKVEYGLCKDHQQVHAFQDHGRSASSVWAPLIDLRVCGTRSDMQKYVAEFKRFIGHTASFSFLHCSGLSFHTIDIGTVPGHAKYNGAVLKDDMMYLVPYNQNNVGLFNTTSQTFSKVDIPVSGNGKYTGAALKDDIVFFGPDRQANIGLFNTTSNKFSKLDISEAAAFDKYAGLFVRDDIVYFSAFRAKSVGILNVTSHKFSRVAMPSGFEGGLGGAMKDGMIYTMSVESASVGIFNTASKSFSTVDCPIPGSIWQYAGPAVVKGDIIYFAPQNADGVGLFDTTSQRFTTVDTHMYAGGIKFMGAVVNKDMIYFAPWGQSKIGILNVTSKRLDTIETNISGTQRYLGGVVKDDVIYFPPRDAPGIGCLRTNFVEVVWASSSREALSGLRKKVFEAGRTAPCVLKGRNCSDYTGFGHCHVDCREDVECLGATVNLRKVTRPSWVNCLTRAAGLTSYYEISATAVLMTLYFGYLMLARLIRHRRGSVADSSSSDSESSIGRDCLHIVFESASRTEIRNLNEGR